jgi:peptidoglycan-associated lipoprotein
LTLQRKLACALLWSALSGCAASWPEWSWPSWPSGPVADASTPRVIFFERDAYKVDDSYRPMLEAHARRMKAMPSLRLLIEAYADRHGANEYNLALSRKRAETVMKQLVALGVPPERMEIAGHGEVRHTARNGMHEAASDRRVELVYR